MFFFIKQKIDFFDCIRITLFLIGRAGGKKEWAELDTVIRPLTKDKKNTAQFVDDIPTRAQSNESIQQPPRERQRARKKVPNPKDRRTRFLSMITGVVIVVVTALMGLLIGHRIASITSTGTSAVSVPSDPRLEVYLPDGAMLYIDGNEVRGNSPIVVPLIPDRSHVVRITKQGHFPVETVVKLRKNDIRLLTIETAELHKKRQ